MKIQIVSPEKDAVFQTVLRSVLLAIHELQIDATVDEITKLEEVTGFPVTTYPAVYIDSKLQREGHSLTLTDAKHFIRKALQMKNGDQNE